MRLTEATSSSISPQMGWWHMCMKVCECATAVQGGTRTYQITVIPPPCANAHSHKAIQAWHPRSPCKLVFTAKETTARTRTGRSAICACKATANGLEISGLIVSPWDTGGTDVSFFLCEEILLFIHLNIKTEEYE